MSSTYKVVIINYIVQYTDPVYQVDGSVKTYHFDSEEEAWRHLEWLSTYREDITDAKLIKQTSRITRERLN